MRERSNFKERKKKGRERNVKGETFFLSLSLSLSLPSFLFFHATRCLKSQFRSVLDEFSSRKIAFDECHYSVPPLTIQCDFSLQPSSATFHPKRSLSRRLFLAHWLCARALSVCAANQPLTRSSAGCIFLKLL